MWLVLALSLCLVGMLILTACCCGCTIFSDDFAADNLATNWDDRSGTWTVSGGVLSTTSASALIVATTPVTAGLTGVYTSVKITPATTSDIGRLVIAWTDDSNYWFCEVQPGTNHGWLRLYERSGGTNTLRMNARITGFQANEQVTVAGCYADGEVRFLATLGAVTAGVQYPATITIAAKKSGVGTGAGSSDVEFDDFSIQKHDTDAPDCEECAEPCGIFSDDFSTDDLAADYNAVSGSWAITSSRLDPPTDGILTLDAIDPLTDGVRVQATCNFGGSTGRLRLIVDYVDSSNYHFIDVNCSGSTTANARIFKRTGGTDTGLGASVFPLSSFSWSTDFELAICWDGDIIGWTFNDTQGLEHITTGHSGATVGLQSASVGGSARFDDIQLMRLGDDCESCNTQIACDLCLDGLAPRFLKLVLAGIVDDTCTDCDNFNGTYLLDTGSGISHNPACPGDSNTYDSCTWATADDDDPCLPAGGSGSYVSIHLMREAGGGTEYILLVQMSCPRIVDPSYTGPQVRWKWVAVLADQATEPVCIDLLEIEHDPIEFTCATSNAGAQLCNLANSTATVSVP